MPSRRVAPGHDRYVQVLTLKTAAGSDVCARAAPALSELECESVIAGEEMETESADKIRRLIESKRRPLSQFQNGARHLSVRQSQAALRLIAWWTTQRSP